MRRDRNPRHDALARRLHGTCGRRRDSNPLFPGAKYPKSSPSALPARAGMDCPREQARTARPPRESFRFQRGNRSLSPPGCSAAAKHGQNSKTNSCRGALQKWRAAIANPFVGSPCHRWSALARAVPSGRPRALDSRQSASPEIRVSPFRLCAGPISNEDAGENKKPSGASAREGLRVRQMSARLRESAPMSRACVIEWPIANQFRTDGLFAQAKHRPTHVRSRTPCP